jgi:hypothetical protein
MGAFDEYVPNRYKASVRLPRGKFAVEFRVQNRSGKVEELSGITLIVHDQGDFD